MVIKIIQIQLHLVQQTGNSNNLFFSMITMQVLYSMFISVLLFDKYSKDRATGARICKYINRTYGNLFINTN